MKRKIKSPDEIGGIAQDLKKQNKKIVYCHGVFDLFHPGHLKHLEEAKAYGNILIVSISPDQFVNKGPNRPVYNSRVRSNFISSIEIVDFVFINESPSAVEAILSLKPNFFAKGKEYETLEDLTGHVKAEKDSVESIGGEMIFVGDTVFSSTNLLNSFFSVLSPNAEKYLNNFRQTYQIEQIFSFFDEVQNLRILIIGDQTFHEFCYCNSTVLSHGSSAINARQNFRETHLGGVGAIAQHLAGFTDHLSVSANIDNACTYAEFFKTELACAHVHLENTIKVFPQVETFFIDNRGHVLFQLTKPHSGELHTSCESEVVQFINEADKFFDVLLVLDLGLGLLTPLLIQAIKSFSGFKAVHCQTVPFNPQRKLAYKYSGVDYICISSRDIPRSKSELKENIVLLSDEIHLPSIGITKGPDGSMIYVNGHVADIPAFTVDVIYTIGAKETYFAFTSLALASGLSADLTAFIGSCVGSMIVRNRGNKEIISKTNLQRFITALLK